MIFIFSILLFFNPLHSKVFNLKLIKQDGTILYSKDGGRNWKSYREVTEKYYTQCNEISISKSIDDDIENIRMLDYKGNVYSPALINLNAGGIHITLPNENIFIVLINFKKTHYTFIINNIR